MSLKQKKVLITGADGFIGSHLTEALVNQGYDVRAFVYYNSFNEFYRKFMENFSGNNFRILDVMESDLNINIQEELSNLYKNNYILL